MSLINNNNDIDIMISKQKFKHRVPLAAGE